MKFAKDFIFLPTNIRTKKELEDRSWKSEVRRKCHCTSDFRLRTPDLL